MKSRIFFLVIAAGLLATFAAAGCSSGNSLWREDKTSQVLVLPFKINGPPETQYLQQGILDMLASRLAKPGKVIVLPKSEAQAAFDKAGGAVDRAKAQEIGESLLADYTLFGSATVIGNNVSIDASLVDVAGEKDPINFIAQSEGLDGVIPKLNEFAGRIDSTVFSGMNAQPSPQPIPAGTDMTKTDAAPINPNFTAIPQIGTQDSDNLFWEGPVLDEALVGLAAADLDGDGKNELVYASRGRVVVGRVENKEFHQLDAFQAQSQDKLLSVDVGDFNKDGRPEIFVSNQRRFEASSYVLDFKNGRISVLVKDAPYFFRVVALASGPELVGQMSGVGERFGGRVMKMEYKGGRYMPTDVPPLPKAAYVFNFAVGDFTGTKKKNVVLVKGSNLTVMSPEGRELWTGADSYAETMIFMEESYSLDRDTADRHDKPKKYFLPSRLIITDLNQDGINEVVVSKTDSRFGSEYLPNWRSIKGGQIVSLGYRQMALRPDWISPVFSGALVDYAIADFDNNGQLDLVAAVCFSPGGGLFEKPRSGLFAYELKLPGPPAGAEAPKPAE
ncbi:MAG: FG-GAP-like repeat-containing protein [Pseudomonadota bacterium]